MSKFDDRVNQLVDEKVMEVTKLFQDGPNNFPNLEADFSPVMEKLQVMHNLLADVKQEVRRVEKQNTIKKEEKERLKPIPELPEGVDITDLTLEDLRQYVDPGTEVVPYNPSENVWEAFERRIREWFPKFRIPGISPDYIEELLKGIKDAGWMNLGLSPADWWYFITHDDTRGGYDAPGYREIIKWLFFPSTLGQDVKEEVQKQKDLIDQSRAEAASNAETINNHIDQSEANIKFDISAAVDTADDLASQILTEVVTCCASTTQRLDVIRRMIEQGGGEMVKQDTLLVRKKMSEIDSILEELRRELRRISEVRSNTEKWLEERKRDSSYPW